MIANTGPCEPYLAPLCCRRLWAAPCGLCWFLQQATCTNQAGSRDATAFLARSRPRQGIPASSPAAWIGSRKKKSNWNESEKMDTKHRSLKQIEARLVDQEESSLSPHLTNASSRSSQKDWDNGVSRNTWLMQAQDSRSSHKDWDNGVSSHGMTAAKRFDRFWGASRCSNMVPCERHPTDCKISLLRFLAWFVFWLHMENTPRFKPYQAFVNHAKLGSLIMIINNHEVVLKKKLHHILEVHREDVAHILQYHEFQPQHRQSEKKDSEWKDNEWKGW